MRLEDDGTGTHPFSPLACEVARRASLIETTMGSRQRLQLGKSPLPGSLPGPIDIHEKPRLRASVHDPTRESKRGAGQQILLEERAQGLDTRLIQRREEARKRRARGQAGAAKQGHEDVR